MSQMTKFRVLLSSAATVAVLCGGGVAKAHFKLLAPTSWLNEDQVGGPQKGSPCGPGGMGLLGDDVSPVPESGKVTEVHAGETIKVEIQETIYHPGYFRIALAENRADLKIPPVDDPMSCALDLSKVPKGAHDNVLMDGLWQEESMSGSNRHLTQEVTIPNKPCENCTLQVVQVMKDHGLSSCYYYHCANLKILPGTGSGTAGQTGSSSAAGMGAAASGTGGGGVKAAAGSSAAGASAGAVATVAGAGSAATSTSAAGAGATGGSAVGAAGAAPGKAGTAAPSPTTPAGTAATSSAPASTASTTSASTAAGTTGTATSTAPASPSTSSAPSSGSCSVVGPGSRRDSAAALFVLVAGLAVGLRGAGRRKTRH